jgi:hypothetical protein
MDTGAMIAWLKDVLSLVEHVVNRKGRQALLRKLRDPQYAKLIETRGYGPAIAIACNENEPGRDKNSRGEVWVR